MTLITILLKASILIFPAVLIHALCGRRMSAAMRHLMWTLVMGGLLVLPVLAFVLPTWTAFTTTAVEARVPTPAVRQEPANLLQSRSELQASSSKPAEPTGKPSLPATIPWSSGFAILYAAGTLFFLVRLMVERMLIRSLLGRATEATDSEWRNLWLDCAERMNVGQTVRLFRSRQETMPMALGIRGGAILIPAVADTWSEDRRRAVLLHEMAHLARHDCLIQMLAAVVCAFYWVHPGIWWISRRLRTERELACDDRVLSAGTNAREYASHLLELAYALRSGRPPVLAVSMAGSGQLEGRMRAVLDAARNRAIPALRSHLIGLAILMALLVPLAAGTISVRYVTGKSVPTTRQATQRPAVEPVQDPTLPGTWDIQPTSQPRFVQVRLREGHSSYSTTIDIDHTDGFPIAQYQTADGPVRFSVSRDAGTFTFEGIVRRGIGAGTYTFTPSATFPAELAKRGLGQPSPGEQRLLARADIGFAFLDELAAQRYEYPKQLVELIRAAQQGVSLSYLRDMGRLGYRLGRLDGLLELRNHGVDPQFIRELAAQGLSRLSTDDLLRARGSGVDPEYIGELNALGYPKLSLDALIQLRRHGVDPEYVRDLGTLGYQNLSLDTLIQLRNHGVDPEYARDLDQLGYSKLSLDTLIQLRNHGVDPEYARDLGTLGYSKLPLDTLILLRNHGVDPEYIRELGMLGYPNLPLDSLIELRNHGVDPEYIRDLQNAGYSGLKVEDLISLRQSGMSPHDIRGSNGLAGWRLSIENLRSLASRLWR